MFCILSSATSEAILEKPVKISTKFFSNSLSLSGLIIIGATTISPFGTNSIILNPPYAAEV